jgi:hypothetical protein
MKKNQEFQPSASTFQSDRWTQIRESDFYFIFVRAHAIIGFNLHSWARFFVRLKGGVVLVCKR